MTLCPVGLLTLVAALAAAGCVNLRSTSHTVVHHDDMGHRRVSNEFVAGLTPGTTTADGVRWNLGKPNWEFAGGRILVYSWFAGESTSFGIAGQAGGSTGTEYLGSSASGGTSHLVMEFGPDGLLLSQRTLKDVRINPNATSLGDLADAPDTTRPSR